MRVEQVKGKMVGFLRWSGTPFSETTLNSYHIADTSLSFHSRALPIVGKSYPTEI